MKSVSPQSNINYLSRTDRRSLRGPRMFPRLEYQYQATTKRSAGASIATDSATAARLRAAQLRSFRALSSAAAGPANRAQSFAEATAFGIIVGIVAWPLVSLLIVLAQTARG
jgi:hypothetical protein